MPETQEEVRRGENPGGIPSVREKEGSVVVARADAQGTVLVGALQQHERHFRDGEGLVHPVPGPDASRVIREAVWWHRTVIDGMFGVERLSLVLFIESDSKGCGPPLF